jgi:hypothetical protein
VRRRELEGTESEKLESVAEKFCACQGPNADWSLVQPAEFGQFAQLTQLHLGCILEQLK